MYNFNYSKAGSADAASQALASAEDGKVMAGGMTLIPTLKQRLAAPSDVIDLAGANLSGIRKDGNAIVIGAMTTHATVAGSADVKSAIPALADLADGIGDPAVRNRGTIGGSIANNDPAADYPSALVALGATVKTTKREIAADDFFTGMFETALDEDEIITEVSFPVPEKAGYAKFPNPASRYAIVGSFVAKTAGGVRVAITGAAPCVFRVQAWEDALSSNFSADAISDGAVDAGSMNADIHAGADYRAHLCGVMTKRAVAKAG
ncbi:MAG: FAD binding domain-containing protein [Minwuia sp.]|uniref:FAD binding domain-containing protein n=1 Tax=Minwuia sp. TaxID=2493630 RepID=UPI003A8B7F0B